MKRIKEMSDLRPGDIGFGPIDGGAGVLVSAGQLLLAERVRIKAVKIDHVFVVVSASNDPAFPSRVYPNVVEAMPGGARCVTAIDRWTNRYAYVRPDYDVLRSFATGNAEQHLHVAEMLETFDLGCAVAGEATKLIGTPYSILDYTALAMLNHSIDQIIPEWLEKRIRQRVTDSGHMICSQLADQAMTRAGYPVFDDGRISQDVTPGALFERLLDRGGTYCIPGVG